MPPRWVRWASRPTGGCSCKRVSRAGGWSAVVVRAGRGLQGREAGCRAVLLQPAGLLALGAAPACVAACPQPNPQPPDQPALRPCRPPGSLPPPHCGAAQRQTGNPAGGIEDEGELRQLSSWQLLPAAACTCCSNCCLSLPCLCNIIACLAWSLAWSDRRQSLLPPPHAPHPAAGVPPEALAGWLGRRRRRRGACAWRCAAKP